MCPTPETINANLDIDGYSFVSDGTLSLRTRRRPTCSRKNKDPIPETNRYRFV